MIFEILLRGVWLRFRFPDGSPTTETVVYPYLEALEAIVDSTSAESGSTKVNLNLSAFPLIGFPLGSQGVVRKGQEILFDGIINDVQIGTSLILQLEA